MIQALKSHLPYKHMVFLLVLSIGLSLYTALFAHMNNWLIFRSSFFHLFEGGSLYTLYPEDQNDLFKYSPAFALFMAPLAILPAWMGAVLWNLIGAFLFILALKKLPLPISAKKGIFWISLPEFIGSTQGFQSNIHVIALLILSFCYLEKGKEWKSMLSLTTSAFIKIFGGLGLCLGVFYLYNPLKAKPEEKNVSLRNLPLVKLVFLVLFFSFLPALFIGWDALMFQYQEWQKLLSMDAAASYGFSLMGVVHGFTGLEFNRLPWQIFGGLSLMLSFLFFRKGNQNTRLMGLVTLCYFLIVFNHKSESSTFIIAMTAFGIHQGLIINQKLRWGLIVFTMICVSLMYSDLFRSIKQSHLDVYSVKVWPFLILYPLALSQWNIRREPGKEPSLSS